MEAEVTGEAAAVDVEDAGVDHLPPWLARERR